MVHIKIEEGRGALETLADEWRALTGDTFTATFASPAWHQASLDVFAARSVVVITARMGERLVGAFPLARMGTDARGLYFSRITIPGRGDYNAPAIQPGVLDEVFPAILEAAFKRFGQRGTYWFPNIPVSEPSLETLRRCLARNRMVWVEERESAPRLRLDGADFAAAEQIWPSSHRKDVRRQRKRLAEKGPVSLWQPASVEEGAALLDEFFEVHDAKWLAQGFPGIFQDRKNREYFHSIWRRMYAKGVHFSTLRCGDTNVSYHFGFSSGGWIQWYRPSYRHEYGGFSPSKIHIAMLIEEVCRQHGAGFDFLLGAEGYKNLWCNDELETVSIHAGFHNWSPSYFWFSRGKPFMRDRLQAVYIRARAWMQKRKQRAGHDS